MIDLFLQVHLRTVPDPVGVGLRTVVAVPPSAADTPGRMRILVNGAEAVTRDYDPELEQP